MPFKTRCCCIFLSEERIAPKPYPYALPTDLPMTLSLRIANGAPVRLAFPVPRFELHAKVLCWHPVQNRYVMLSSEKKP